MIIKLIMIWIFRIYLKKYFKCMYLNARTLKNKIDGLEILINNEKLDLICIAEHWFFKRDIKKCNFQNYNAEFAFKNCRGSCILIHKSIKYKIITN